MAQAVTTAVVAAAGQGTRMWPATKVYAKELFPLGRIPVIVHIVWELIDAGITDIIIVTGRHNRRDITTLFDHSASPPIKLAGDPLVERFQRILNGCSISIIEQTGDYGNGTPLLLAARQLGERPCVYAFGDDVVIGENVTHGLLATFDRTGCTVIAAQEVPAERTGSFGILESQLRDGAEYVTRFVEKPSPGETISTLASFGRYVVDASILDAVGRVGRGRDGELWFTDAVIAHLRDAGRICAFRLTRGRWYTVGDPAGYADAVRAACVGLT